MTTYISIGLLLVLSWSSMIWADSESSQQLKKIQTEIHTISEQINQTKLTKSELYQQLEQQSQAISKLKLSLHRLQQTIKKQSQQLKMLEDQQKSQLGAHAKQLASLNQQLRAAYIVGQPHYLKVLLNQQDPAQLSRANIYFRYFHRARQQQLVEINTALNAITNSQQQLYSAQAYQKKLYAEQQQQQRAFDVKNQQRIATLKQLDQKIEKQQDRVVLLREQERSLQSVLDSISTTSIPPPLINSLDTPAFASLKGSLNWPIQGKVIARYGSTRNLGKLTWQGIMIDASAGQEVIAAAAGRVVFSDWLRGFGLLLIVDHGDQYMTLYGNNQSLMKEVGDYVKAGELIALSGDKGIRQHAGLYFEIRHKGNPTNPTKWLRKQRS